MHSIRNVLMAALAALALPAQAGWQYTAVTKATGGRHSEMMGNTAHGLINGEQARIEFAESGNPMIRAGSYLLSKDGGQTMYLVNPRDKTYTRWDMGGMMGMAGGAMKMMNMQFKDTKVEKLLEEKGAPMLGQPTTHYKFRTSYTMEMNFMGMKSSTATVREEELWVAAGMRDAGLGAWSKQQGFKSGNEQLDQMIAAEQGKVRGFPLKSVAVTKTTDAKGQEQTTQVAMEVTQLKESAPAADQFELPAGYSETSMAMPGGDKGRDAAPRPAPQGANPLFQMMKGLSQ